MVYGRPTPILHTPAGRGEYYRRRVTVTSGVLAASKCEALNVEWNTWIATGLPYVIAKAGMTLDGRINSPPEGRWIASPASRRDAMNLRRRGAEPSWSEVARFARTTPSLTIRGGKVDQQPLRVIWTKQAGFEEGPSFHGRTLKTAPSCSKG